MNNPDYSPLTQNLLFVAWGVVSLGAAWFAKRPRTAYLVGVVFAIPALYYSTIEYGLIEMGGIVHALSAGLYPLLAHYAFQAIKGHKRRRDIPPS